MSSAATVDGLHRLIDNMQARYMFPVPQECRRQGGDTKKLHAVVHHIPKSFLYTEVSAYSLSVLATTLVFTTT